MFFINCIVYHLIVKIKKVRNLVKMCFKKNKNQDKNNHPVPAKPIGKEIEISSTADNVKIEVDNNLVHIIIN